MSAIGYALLFIIVIALVAVFGNQASEFWTAASNYAQASNANFNLQINPAAGQNVCNLKIVFNPTLVALPAVGQSVNTAILGVVAGWQMNGAQYSWTNCHAYGNPLQMSWVPLSFLSSSPRVNGTNPISNLATNDILLSAGQTVHLDLTVVSPNGGIRSYTSDPFCSQFCTSISIPAGTVFVPKQYTFTFVITNLPQQNYQVQVTSELGFNGQNSGLAYTQNIGSS